MGSSQVDDSITKKYDIKRRIGKGAYGIVWKAVDRATNRPVAVKKIFDAFCNSTDAQRTFREIMFLQEFRNHPNIVKLLNIHRASNDKDIYLIFEYMDTDLHEVIQHKHIPQDLHKRFIMYQLLKATYYIHSGNVIHRDQKPSNILLDSYCHCKIADFGLARSLASDGAGAEGVSNPAGPEGPALTDYVATRWYRAPEILVASKQYTKGVDMWSLGCILAEMLLGKPLFPGTSTINQVEKIMATIDPPTPADLACVCPGYGSSLFTRAPAGRRLPLSEILRGAPVEGLDLVCRLLVLNPFKRLTAEQALEHPYVARFRRRGREPSLQRQIVPLLSDHVQLSVGEYRNKLYEMYQPNCVISQDSRPVQPSPAHRAAHSGGSSSSSSSSQGGSRCKPSKAVTMASQGGGDSGVAQGTAPLTQQHHGHPNNHHGAAGRAKKHPNANVGGSAVAAAVGAAPKVKSGGGGSSGTSGGSAPLSTPPLRKPTRPPRDPEVETRKRQTRHLSAEDVRPSRHVRSQHANHHHHHHHHHHHRRHHTHGLHAAPTPGQATTGVQTGTVTASEHLLPRRLSASDSAVASQARTPQQRRPPHALPTRRLCHAQLDRVGDVVVMATGASGAAPAFGGSGSVQKAVWGRQQSRGSRITNNPQLALAASVGIPLAAPRTSGSLSRLHPPAPPPPHCSSTHSLGGRPNQGPGRHHPHRPAATPGFAHASSLLGTETVGNIGFISAAGLSELRPGYRWQR